jgi:hypothetical protein
MNRIHTFFKIILIAASFALPHAHAQDITGDWYLSEFEYERIRGGSSSTSAELNLELSIEALGNNRYRVEVTGEDGPEELELTQQGNRFFMEDFEESGESGNKERERNVQEWIDDDIMMLTRVTIHYGGEFDRLYYFQAGATVFTRNPLPATQPNLWPGNYTLREIGLEAVNGNPSISFWNEQISLDITAMAGNTYAISTPDEKLI